MSHTIEPLILDLLEWIGPHPRPYAEVMDAWRTSCPRLPVWEEAIERSFIEQRHEPRRGTYVSVSALGAEHLGKNRRLIPPARMDDGILAVERLQAANELALARAHLRFPAVLGLEQQAPAWLLRMSMPAGVADFESRHSVRLPEALRMYYQSLRLICLLQAAWDVDVFLEGLDSPDPPEVRSWNGKLHLVIGYFPHGASVCGAEIVGNNQYMYWEGFSENRQPDLTLADWVHGAAVRLLADKVAPDPDH